MDARGSIRTDRAREQFLAVLRHSCNVSASARAAGISRRAAYEWRDSDPEFAADWADAVEEAADRLEEIAWKRAEEESDRMLEILLKGHRPEKYVDRIRAEHTGKDGDAIKIEQVVNDADAFARAIAGIASRGSAGS